MKAVLIRHSETDWNVAHKMQGHTDTLLNENGRTQAALMADMLEPLSIARIYTSDLKRALETGQIISLRLGVPVRADQRLRECKFGELEGLTFGEITKQTKFYENAGEPYDFTGYGGESKAQVIKRHLDFLAEAKTKHPEETILVIGHGTGLNTLLSALNQDPHLKRGELRFLDLS